MSALWTSTSTFGVKESCCTNASRLQFFSRMRRKMVASAGPSGNWDNSVNFNLEVSDPCSSSSSEASSLIALCQDLDWEACVDALRREASLQLVKKKEIELARSKLNAQNGFKEDWDYNQAISDLRKQASLQAAEQLVKKLNRSSDVDATVLKLAEHIFLSCCQMSEDQGGGNGSTGLSKAAGVVLSMLAGLQSWSLANAAEEAISQASKAADEAAASGTTTHVPSWFGAALLGIPVASYLVFNVYRDKVNPEASIMDFLFAMGALLIVGNLVTSATLGVRLY